MTMKDSAVSTIWPAKPLRMMFAKWIMWIYGWPKFLGTGSFSLTPKDNPGSCWVHEWACAIWSTLTGTMCVQCHPRVFLFWKLRTFVAIIWGQSVSIACSETLSDEIRHLSMLWDQKKALLYLIFAKDISLGNAEQQRIGNLPSSASDQNSNRLRLQDKAQNTAVRVINIHFTMITSNKATLQLYDKCVLHVYSCLQDLLMLGLSSKIDSIT